MKITIQENERLEETEVIIHCRQTDDETLRLVAALRGLDRKLTGTKDGRTFVVETVSVLYFVRRLLRKSENSYWIYISECPQSISRCFQ